MKHHARPNANVGYLRYDVSPPPPPPGETPEARLKRLLKAMPPGAFNDDPRWLVEALKRANRREP